MKKVVRAGVVVALLAGSLVAGAAGSSTAATPVVVDGAAWAAALAQATNQPPVLSATGDIAISACPRAGIDPSAQPAPLQILDNVGDTRFNVGAEASSTCNAAIASDNDGNWYIPVTPDPQGSAWVLRSVDAANTLRWSAPLAGQANTGSTVAQTAVVGHDGNVYVQTIQGPAYTIEGFSVVDGKAAPAVPYDSIRALNLGADSSGLVVVHANGVRYLPYDRSAHSETLVGYQVMASDVWLDGAVFTAGYAADCSTLFVHKLGHNGIVWTYQVPATACRQMSLRATPDGGVIMALSSDDSGSYDYRSIAANPTDGTLGKVRWTHSVPVPALSGGIFGADGLIAAFPGSGYVPPLVDEHGNVAVFGQWRLDPLGHDPIYGIDVHFLDQTTGAETLPFLRITDTSGPGWLTNTTMTSGINRLYVALSAGGPKPSSLAAFNVQGLGRDSRALMIPGRPVAPKCADVLFYGARGSSEKGPGTPDWVASSDDPLGLGGTVAAAERQFKATLGTGRTVSARSLQYAATPVPIGTVRISTYQNYFSGIAAGVQQLQQDLLAEQRVCPDQRIVLAGYSQGAMVMRRTLENMLSLSSPTHDLRPRVDAVILIGDGDRLAKDNGSKFGTMTPKRNGVSRYLGARVANITGARLVPLPRSVRNIIFSVCNKDDVVCDTRLATAGKGYFVHTGYADNPALARGAAAAARSVHARPWPLPSRVQITGITGTAFVQQFEAEIASGYTLRWRVAAGSALPAGATLTVGGLYSGVLPAGEVNTTLEVSGVILGQRTTWVPVQLTTTGG